MYVTLKDYTCYFTCSHASVFSIFHHTTKINFNAFNAPSQYFLEYHWEVLKSEISNPRHWGFNVCVGI